MANSQNLTQAGKGRPKGVTNKVTREIRELARVHGPAAIEKILYLMDNAEREETRLSAAKELLDRGFGKSTQMVATDEDAGGMTINVVTGVPRGD